MKNWCEPTSKLFSKMVFVILCGFYQGYICPSIFLCSDWLLDTIKSVVAFMFDGRLDSDCVSGSITKLKAILCKLFISVSIITNKRWEKCLQMYVKKIWTLSITLFIIFMISFAVSCACFLSTKLSSSGDKAKIWLLISLWCPSARCFDITWQCKVIVDSRYPNCMCWVFIPPHAKNFLERVLQRAFSCTQ